MKKYLALLVVSGVLAVIFQNCSQVKISPVDKGSDLSGTPAAGDNSASSTPSPEPTPAPVPAPPPPMIGPGPNPTTPGVAPNPFNPQTPGVVLLPSDGEWFSIAYEDNILSPTGGDRDFNDAVFNYKIAEQYNTKSELVKIFIEVKLREKISGNNHLLYLVLNGEATPEFTNIAHKSLVAFNGQANVTITTPGTEMTTSFADAKNLKLKLFSATKNMKGKVAKVQIDLKNPELNINTSTTKVVNYKKYRFILQNQGQTHTGIDVAEINPTGEMLSNGNHYPFGFVIPTDWQPPSENQLIDDKYPNFYKYREWLNGSQNTDMPADVKNWYKPL